MLRVLTVEDNPYFREIFKAVFSNKFSSLIFEEARNGEEALQKIRGKSIDLIFLDILLPGEDGLKLAHKIREDFPAADGYRSIFPRMVGIPCRQSTCQHNP